MATEKNWEDILRTNYTELLENIDTETGLYGELQKVKIFTQIALKKYTCIKDTTKKKEWMLSSLQKKDFESFKKFCEILNNSGQEHIVRMYLSEVQDVSCRQVTVTDSPLNEDSSQYRGVPPAMLECIKLHWNDLIIHITFDDGLLSQIQSRNILRALQLNMLKDMETEDKRTDQMLHWLQCGSEKQFIDFCDALTANNEQHLVKQYLTPKIPEPKIPAPNPRVIQENATQSHEIHRAPEIGIGIVPGIHKDPEGSSGDVPVAAGVTVKDSYFFPCSQEFVIDFQAKVVKKAAYKCDSKPRGRALIMNNKFFDRLSTRLGSDVDTENLQGLFSRLNFNTVVHSDKDAQEMRDILKTESQASHHKVYDMFVLFMMSHGIQGEIYGVDGNSLRTADIVNMFNGINCPHLLSKPKLFFIQACQGDVKTPGVIASDGGMKATDSGMTTTDSGMTATDSGMTATDSGMTATDSGMTECDSAMPVQHQDAIMEEMMRKLNLVEDFQMSIPLPLLPEFASDAVADNIVHEMADMAVIYATVEGHVAWRRVDTGSLFVSCFVNVLKKRAHETALLQMITETFSDLHELEMVENQGRFKQIGEKRDSLRREVYLLPL